MKRCTLALLLALASLGSIATAADAPRRPIQAQDLLQFQWMGDVQMSPKGGHIAYVGVQVDAARTDYDTTLHLVSSSGNDARRLTTGKRDSEPRWSPDGNFLAFLRAVEKDGKPQPAQLFVLPMNGGEAQQITRIPGGVSHPSWSPDGKALAFMSRVNASDLTVQACDERKDRSSTECLPQRDSDVKVITRAGYRDNNTGYLDFSRSRHLWTVAMRGGEAAAPPRLLTSGDVDKADYVWSADSARLIYAVEREIDAGFGASRYAIMAQAVAGGPAQELAQFPGSLRGLSLSPNGKQLAFYGSLAEPVQSHTHNNLFVLELTAPAKLRNLTDKLEGELGVGLAGDQGAPRAGGSMRPLWSPDGKSITAVVATRGRADLERFDLASGQGRMLTQGDHTVSGYSSDGRSLVARINSATELDDLYLIGPGSPPKRLTYLNRSLFQQLNLSKPRDLWYAAADGRKIHALVQYPPDYDAGKQYPLILNIHGGPHTAYGYTFFHEAQWMAAKGYVVLYPNPRGSTTYGEAFANIIQYRYPGDDYGDLMAGVDALLKEGNIDPKRLGVTGGSGGGLLTNWVIGHTQRFAAAVSARDIADWTAWWYSADLNMKAPTWFAKPPFEDPEDFRARSPITYVKQVQTPTMFVLGDADTRTPAESGGEQMFRALKYRNIPTVMVRFPGATHELSRSGKPWHRVERLQHILNWFDIYLQGKRANDYDIVPPARPDLRAAPLQ